MILVVDNYDSFTWNLVHYLGEAGAETRVVRNDALTVSEAMASGADAFLISPGPGTPAEAGISLALVAACAEARRPLLGVCLGHQAIAQSFGGHVRRAARPMHGKTSTIAHDGSGLFADLPSPFTAARYHSLDVDPDRLPQCLLPVAWTGDGSLMAVRHASHPIHGIQFHPESIASEHGHAILRRFVEVTGAA